MKGVRTWKGGAGLSVLCESFSLALWLVSLLQSAAQENPVDRGTALDLGGTLRLCSNSLALFDM